MSSGSEPDRATGGASPRGDPAAFDGIDSYRFDGVVADHERCRCGGIRMAEKRPLTTVVQELAWELARQEPAGERRMEVSSPWEPGLTHEQRRKAWLATLATLTSLQTEVERLAETAASRAVEYGADYPDISRATGATPKGVRRRWPRLAALLGGKNGRPGHDPAGPAPELGTLSAPGRAASSRLDGLAPW